MLVSNLKHISLIRVRLRALSKDSDRASTISLKKNASIAISHTTSGCISCELSKSRGSRNDRMGEGVRAISQTTSGYISYELLKFRSFRGNRIGDGVQ